MSHWNHRIMRHTEENGVVWYGLHEVYYFEGGEVNWTDDAITPDHIIEPEFEEEPDKMLTDEAMREGLQKSIALIMLAFDKPTLDYKTGKEIT